MLLNEKTLEKLRELINEKTIYRTGPNLVKFFNALGFNDSYGPNFPSRWKYTDEKLQQINGTPELDLCIKKVFAPIEFIENIRHLDDLISEFNKYLVFDGWKVTRNNQHISFIKNTNIDDVINAPNISNNNEDVFLAREFENIPLSNIISDNYVQEVLQTRFNETKQAIRYKLNLSSIFLCGSILEGVLLNIASSYPRLFNQAKSAPKTKDGKTKAFGDWTLSDSINVAYELGFLREDVKKFSHALKDFRNYIHPYEQISHKFAPDSQTAKICFQVLKAALFQIDKKTHEYAKK